MATQWIEVDGHGLRELALLIEQSRQHLSPTLLREIRMREDAYGLSPMSRRRLRSEIGPEDEPRSGHYGHGSSGTGDRPEGA